MYFWKKLGTKCVTKCKPQHPWFLVNHRTIRVLYCSIFLFIFKKIIVRYQNQLQCGIYIHTRMSNKMPHQHVEQITRCHNRNKFKLGR
ncbi:hypothetical protein HanIR_Chr17g0850511 [Helianthus annuus]|nr:hypothetical protein HanIR_Chr17g0850511 [Helianthus annuus]